MKKIIKILRITYDIYIISLIVICLTSCVGTKKLEKSNITQKQQTNTEVSKNSLEKNDLTTSVNSEKKSDELIKNTISADENEQTTIRTINYDPKSDIVSGTDRPKVISETIQNTTKCKKTAESTQTLYSESEVTALFSKYLKTYNSKIDSLNKVNSSLESKITTKTSSISNWWKWIIAGLILGSGITILIYQMKWYETIWNFIKKIFRR